ncbi:hypothetical protein BDV93DRAFT_520942 [Ceratobasidium sp. AG-I]|nr:hypothetical protein BDV93DRAFT_520942 [Ceratobasidium sp. AG-I]
MAEDASSNADIQQTNDKEKSIATTTSNFTSGGGTAATPAQVSFKLWNPPSSGAASSSFALTDLEPTAAEIVAAYQAQSKRTENLRNAPLLTQQIRDQQQAAKLKKWPTTVIRIRFANQMQLEKSFSSSSKIKPVYAFVRDCLNDEAKAIKFVLYQPPARELKVSDEAVRDKTLIELQLAPASVLLLRFLSDKFSDRDMLPPLNESILASAVDFPATPIAPAGDEPQSANTKVMDEKQVNNKLARFLKLRPKP